MKLIVLDRDGVINFDSPDYIKSAREWNPIPGSLEAIARLCHAGYRVAIASNQSGIGRGLFTLDALFGIHDKMSRMVADFGGRIDAIAYCPHTPDDGCQCRKPLPGMLTDIGERLQYDLRGVPVVGDSWRDLQAAMAVKATPMLVRTGNGRETEQAHADELKGITVHNDLASLTDRLLQPASH